MSSPQPWLYTDRTIQLLPEAVTQSHFMVILQCYSNTETAMSVSFHRECICIKDTQMNSASVLTWTWPCSPAACLVNYQFLPSHSDLSLWPQPQILAAYFDSSFQSPVCLTVVLSGMSTYATASHCEVETLACDGAFVQGMVPAADQNMHQ
jgi:hypothetical protein